MSKHPFAVGDVIERVRLVTDLPAAPRKTCPYPPIGAVLRVIGIPTVEGEHGVVIQGWRSTHPTGGYHHLAFRHIGKADDAFTEQMKAMRPTRVLA